MIDFSRLEWVTSSRSAGGQDCVQVAVVTEASKV